MHNGIPSSSLPPAHLPEEEMIPETGNPNHDPQYWCLPPAREDLEAPHRGGGKPFHLVTHGHSNGIYRNWTVAKVMVTNHPVGAHHGHDTVADCIAEWQHHCALGLHPHHADPALAVHRSASPRKPAREQPQTPRTPPATQRVKVEVPAPAPMFYAIWNGRTVYSNASEAKTAFLTLANKGKQPKLLTTESYDEALAYSLGVAA
ncbi:hypothetical protein C8R43DRAFT_1130302 [Mycena crocata]|nr:hypothetical protein C8R43DRAFT_1130302 [Mycena crocata]